jgi:hypothetical protein
MTYGRLADVMLNGAACEPAGGDFLIDGLTNGAVKSLVLYGAERLVFTIESIEIDADFPDFDLLNQEPGYGWRSRLNSSAGEEAVKFYFKYAP